MRNLEMIASYLISETNVEAAAAIASALAQALRALAVHAPGITEVLCQCPATGHTEIAAAVTEVITTCALKTLELAMRDSQFQALPQALPESLVVRLRPVG